MNLALIKTIAKVSMSTQMILKKAIDMEIAQVYSKLLLILQEKEKHHKLEISMKNKYYYKQVRYHTLKFPAVSISLKDSKSSNKTNTKARANQAPIQVDQTDQMDLTKHLKINLPSPMSRNNPHPDSNKSNLKAHRRKVIKFLI